MYTNVTTLLITRLFKLYCIDFPDTDYLAGKLITHRLYTNIVKTVHYISVTFRSFANGRCQCFHKGALLVHCSFPAGGEMEFTKEGRDSSLVYLGARITGIGLR